MDNKENLFQEFDPATMDDWAAKVAKELKGRPLEDLNWALEDDLLIAPYLQASSVEKEPSFTLKAPSGDWEIGEYLELDNDLKISNRNLLRALINGVQALRITIPAGRIVSMSFFEQLFQEVELSYISVHFEYLDNDPQSFISNWLLYLQSRYDKLSDIRGSFSWSYVSSENMDLDQLLPQITQKLPLFRLCIINAIAEHSGAENMVNELVQMLTKAKELMQGLIATGLSPATIAPHIQFELAIGTSYFVEIAKLRALQLLWANVLNAYGLKPKELVTISAHLAPDSQTDEPHLNMIRATTQAMSAVLGGVNHLYIRPANAKLEKANAFTRRVARNVQHLLKMESHLDRVVDPAAGSYYIEDLSRKLAAGAWEKL